MGLELYPKTFSSVFTTRGVDSVRVIRVIFLVVGSLSANSISGGEIAFLEIAKRLVKVGFEVFVITSRAGAETYMSRGLKCHYFLLEKKRGLGELPIPLALAIIIKRSLFTGVLLRKLKPGSNVAVVSTSDLVWENIPLAFVGGYKTKRLTIFHMVYPFSAHTIHKGLSSVWTFLEYAQQFLAIRIMKRFDEHVFALSNTEPFLRSVGIDGKTTYFKPGVERELIQERQDKNVKYEACWIGRYSPRKGVDDLFRVWSLVCSHHKDAKLILAGSICEHPKVRRYIRDNHMERNVLIAGFVKETEKFRILQQSKMMVFPSYHEGWPFTVCESLASGVPVIAYDLGVYKYINGGIITVPLGDYHALSTKVLTLLEEPALLARLSAEATSASLAFSWDETFTRFLDILR